LVLRERKVVPKLKMAKNRDKGELLAIKDHKRIYTKPLKPGMERRKKEKREGKKR